MLRRARHGDHLVAVALVILLQSLFATWLLVFPRPRAPGAGSEHPRIQLQWIARTPATATVLVRARRAQTPPTRERGPSEPGDPTPTATAAAGRAGPHGRLDLSLPITAVTPPPTPARQPWERPPTVEFRDTRFDRDWAPDGGEVQQTWAFRSKIAGILLSATGALNRPCNQHEREQRLEKCFGKQYEGDTEPPLDPNE